MILMCEDLVRHDQMSLYSREYLGTFWGSSGLVTMSLPFMAPLYTTSTTSMKSWEVLKLPMNLVWSGVLEAVPKEWTGKLTD